MHMHTYTQTHINKYTYICTCTHTRIHAHTHTHTCTCTHMHRQKISAMTPQRIKQYHSCTYASIYILMHIHIYMHIHICAHPASNVSQMCTLMSKEHLYNTYSCTCTGAKNTWSKLHATLTAQKMHIQIYIYTYAYAYTRTRIHMRIHDTAQTRQTTATEPQNSCTNVHEHTHKHVYTCMRIPIHIHMHIYTYMHVHTHTYVHTYTQCTYARKHSWNDSAAATAWDARLDTTKAQHFSSRNGSASSVQRDPFDEKRRVSAEQPPLTAAHHTITTARHPDNNRSSALVRSRSIQFMARPSCSHGVNDLK